LPISVKKLRPTRGAIWSKYDINMVVLNHIHRCKRAVLGSTVMLNVDDPATFNTLQYIVFIIIIQFSPQLLSTSAGGGCCSLISMKFDRYGHISYV